MSVSPESVLAVLPGAASGSLELPLLESLIAEAEARVLARCGQSSADSPLLGGVVRDLAAARALERLYAGQSAEAIEAASALRRDALERLAEYESALESGGAPDAESTASVEATPW